MTALSTWPDLIVAVTAVILGNTVVTFFVARAVFDRLVLRTLASDESKPAVGSLVIGVLEDERMKLRTIIDDVYRRELTELSGLRGQVDENRQRLSWVDGQIKTQSDQIRDQLNIHNSQMADAIRKLSETMDRSDERNHIAINTLSKELGVINATMAELQGFLRAKDWDGNDRRRDS